MTNLCSRGGLTAWAHSQTASLYSGCGLTAWACGLTVSSGNHGGMRDANSGAGARATLGESFYRKMFKSLVRRGEIEKGKSASSKTTCWETMILLVVRSRHW
jgi:hypothetical protein